MDGFVSYVGRRPPCVWHFKQRHRGLKVRFGGPQPHADTADVQHARSWSLQVGGLLLQNCGETVEKFSLELDYCFCFCVLCLPGWRSDSSSSSLSSRRML